MAFMKIPTPKSYNMIQKLGEITKVAKVQQDFGDIQLDPYDFWWMVQQIENFEDFKSEAFRKCRKLNGIIDEQRREYVGTKNKDNH